MDAHSSLGFPRSSLLLAAVDISFALYAEQQQHRGIEFSAYDSIDECSPLANCIHFSLRFFTERGLLACCGVDDTTGVSPIFLFLPRSFESAGEVAPTFPNWNCADISGRPDFSTLDATPFPGIPASSSTFCVSPPRRGGFLW